MLQGDVSALAASSRAAIVCGLWAVSNPAVPLAP